MLLPFMLMQFFSPKTEFRLILFFEFKQKNIQVKIFAQHQLGSLKWYYYNLLEKLKTEKVTQAHYFHWTSLEGVGAVFGNLLR